MRPSRWSTPLTPLIQRLSALGAARPASTGEDAHLTGTEAANEGVRGKVVSALSERGQQYIDQMALSFAGGSVGVETKVAMGSPAGLIVKEAAARKGSLIAMSTHGRTGIGRWLLGSVAGRVVRHSTEPVLIIRAVTEYKDTFRVKTT